MPLSDGMKLFRRCNELASVTLFVSVLHDRNSATDCFVDDVAEITITKDGRRGVSDEIEAVVEILLIWYRHDGRMQM